MPGAIERALRIRQYTELPLQKKMQEYNLSRCSDKTAQEFVDVCTLLDFIDRVEAYYALREAMQKAKAANLSVTLMNSIPSQVSECGEIYINPKNGDGEIIVFLLGVKSGT